MLLHSFSWLFTNDQEMVKRRHWEVHNWNVSCSKKCKEVHSFHWMLTSGITRGAPLTTRLSKYKQDTHAQSCGCCLLMFSCFLLFCLAFHNHTKSDYICKTYSWKVSSIAKIKESLCTYITSKYFMKMCISIYFRLVPTYAFISAQFQLKSNKQTMWLKRICQCCWLNAIVFGFFLKQFHTHSYAAVKWCFKYSPFVTLNNNIWTIATNNISKPTA